MCHERGKGVRETAQLGSYHLHTCVRTYTHRVDNGSIFFLVFQISNRGVILAGKMPPPRQKDTLFPLSLTRLLVPTLLGAVD